MSDPICLFSSHWSIGSSVFITDVEEDVAKGAKKEIDPDKPVNLFSLAKIYNIAPLIIVEDDFGGFFEAYKSSKEYDIPYVYGLNFTVSDSTDLESPDFKETHSNVILLFKRSQSYYSAVKPYSEGMKQPVKNPHLTWDQFNSYVNDDFEVVIPFYSGFIAKNVMRYKHRAVPKFADHIKPTFLIQQQGLPFDKLLLDKTNQFLSTTDWPRQEAHWCRYFKESDIRRYTCLKIITTKQTSAKRATFEAPELSLHSSNQFAFETYLKKIGRAI